jgi:hypothetical protein
MAVFSNDLDTYAVSMFTTAMGTGSAYTTMKVQTVNRRIAADMFEWQYWTLPAICVACHRIQYSANEHMGSTRKLYRRVYKYTAFGVISGTVNYEVTPTIDTVTDAIKEFYERMEEVLRTNQFTVQSAGVIARDATITEGFFDILRYPEDATSSYRRFGLAHFQFDITAKV